jgi:hypothetical protein
VQIFSLCMSNINRPEIELRTVSTIQTATSILHSVYLLSCGCIYWHYKHKDIRVNALNNELPQRIQPREGSRE